MILETRRRREDLLNIARSEVEARLKGIVTAYVGLFPVPLKGINIRFQDGVIIEHLPMDKRL
jgi:hypothetical protein